MGRFKKVYWKSIHKELYLVESVKESKAKALGLLHISFNNYKDKVGVNWHWDSDKSEFIKGDEREIIQKLLDKTIKYNTTRGNFKEFSFDSIDKDGYLYKGSDSKYYVYQKSFNMVIPILNNMKPSYVNKLEWDKIQDEINLIKKNKLEYWESKQGNLTKINKKVELFSPELSSYIEKLDFLTIPKEYKPVTMEISKYFRNDKVMGMYDNDKVHIKIREPIESKVIYHEMGHWLDCGGQSFYDSSFKYHNQDEPEFMKLVNMVEKLPTVKYLNKLYNDSVEIRWKNNEQVMVNFDEDLHNYYEYISRPREIFARLFSQYICTKLNVEHEYTVEDWPKDEFKEIYEYMDSMFIRMGWMK